jgi:hypothetical protein
MAVVSWGSLGAEKHRRRTRGTRTDTSAAARHSSSRQHVMGCLCCIPPRPNLLCGKRRLRRDDQILLVSLQAADGHFIPPASESQNPSPFMLLNPAPSNAACAALGVKGRVFAPLYDACVATGLGNGRCKSCGNRFSHETWSLVDRRKFCFFAHGRCRMVQREDTRTEQAFID